MSQKYSLPLLLSLIFAAPMPLSATILLALNWKPEPQFGGFYEAERLGLFKKMGLNVSIIEGGSGTPTIQLLGAGKVDAAIISADELVMAYDRGSSDIVAVFATYQTNPQGIMAHRPTGATSKPGLKDLFQDPGKTLLWQSGLPYALYLKNKYSGMKIQQAPYAGGISNFLQNPQVIQQVFVTSEPLLAKAAKVETDVYLAAEEGFNPYTTVLAVRRTSLKKDAETVRKLVAAVKLGWLSYLKDPKLGNEYMAPKNKAMDLNTFAASAQAQAPLIQVKGVEVGSMTVQRWKDLAEQMLKLGLIKKSIPPEQLFIQIP